MEYRAQSLEDGIFPEFKIGIGSPLCCNNGVNPLLQSIKLLTLIGVPGTLGGALSMNAGAYGSEISNHLTSVEMMSMSGKIKNYDKFKI